MAKDASAVLLFTSQQNQLKKNQRLKQIPLAIKFKVGSREGFYKNDYVDKLSLSIATAPICFLVFVKNTDQKLLGEGMLYLSLIFPDHSYH